MNLNQIFALQKVKGIGDVTISRVLALGEQYEVGSFCELTLDHIRTDQKLSRYSDILYNHFSSTHYDQSITEAKNELAEICGNGVSIICISDPTYPKFLKKTHDAPPILFCKGDTSLLSSDANVAVIGNRDSTPRGEIITKKTVAFLTQHGFAIVSGLAAGIDKVAHEETLHLKGKTIAVVPDVTNIYPEENKELAKFIVTKSGLLISENAPGVKVTRSLFVRRDRLQSYLSLAVFPIETKIDGGTMHAIKSAIKENRLVYAPDISLSGYHDREIDQLSGIKEILNNGTAIPYSKALYPTIIQTLDKKRIELSEQLGIKEKGLF